jgi:hypothetical protein
VFILAQQQHTLSYHRHKKKNGISTFNDKKTRKNVISYFSSSISLLPIVYSK